MMMTNKSKNRLQPLVKQHYKAYKSGKRWIFAGITTLALAAGVFYGGAVVHADTDETGTPVTVANATQASDSPAVAADSTESADPTTPATSTASQATDTDTTPAVDSTVTPSAPTSQAPVAQAKPASRAVAQATVSADTAEDSRATNTAALQTTSTTLTDAVTSATTAGVTVTQDATQTLDATPATLANAEAQVATDYAAQTATLADTTAQQEINNSDYATEKLAYETDPVTITSNSDDWTVDGIKTLLGGTGATDADIAAEVKKLANVTLNKKTMTYVQLSSSLTLDDGNQPSWEYKNAFLDPQTGRYIDVVETVTGYTPAKGADGSEKTGAHIGPDQADIGFTPYTVQDVTATVQYFYAGTDEPADLDVIVGFSDLDGNQGVKVNNDVVRVMYGSKVEAEDDGSYRNYDNATLDSSDASGQLWVLQQGISETDYTFYVGVNKDGTINNYQPIQFIGSVSFALTLPTAPVLTVEKASYHTDMINVSTTYTVNYTGAGTETPSAHTATVVWTGSYDPATQTYSWTPDTTDVAVASPTVAGYTPDQATAFSTALGVITTDPVNVTDTVNYQVTQQATVEFIDDDNDGAVVGEPDQLTGVAGQQVDYAETVPAHYDLVDADSNAGTYTFTAAADQVLQIHLTHHLSKTEMTTQDTVYYVGLPTDKAQPAKLTDVVTWLGTTDEVQQAAGNPTATTYVPAVDMMTVTSPLVSGYTANVPAVDFNYQTTTTKPTDQTKTVTFTADPQSIAVTYIDDTTGAELTDLDTSIDGHTGDTGTYHATVPAGYDLSDNQPDVVAYTLGTTAGLTIHLSHHKTTTTQTTTRTVTYVVSGGQAPAPAAQQTTATWQIVTDDLTGTSTATMTAPYEPLTTPTLADYLPSQLVVTGGTLPPTTELNTLTDQRIVVVYTPDLQRVQIQYVDDVTGETLPALATTLPAATNQTVSYTAVVPTGYRLANTQAKTVSHTWTATDATANTITIHLTHEIAHQQVTTTRTITYVVAGPATAPQPVTQTGTWVVETDLVTGASVYTMTTGYRNAISPVLAGYTPDTAVLAAVYLAPQTTEPDDTAAQVTYQADPQQATVEYVDAVTGAVVGTAQTLTGTTGSTTSWALGTLPTGYRLTPGHAATGTRTFTADDQAVIQVPLQHAVKDTTQTTTRTINYVVVDNGVPAPAPVTQQATWLVETDLATGESVATMQNGYALVVSPVVAGYTADQAVIEAAYDAPTATLSDLTNEALTVTYAADPVAPDQDSQTPPATADPGQTSELPPAQTEADGDGDTTPTQPDGATATVPGKPAAGSPDDQPGTTPVVPLAGQTPKGQAAPEAPLAARHRLPHTGDNVTASSWLTVLGVLLASFSLAGGRRRRRQH